MCGIVGAVSTRNIVPILVQGLQRLEYRGYDSCGIAVHAGSLAPQGAAGLQRVRGTARVAELLAQVQAQQLESATGIAHTRWATHGAPTVDNAHPHFSHGACDEAYADAARPGAWPWCTTASSKTTKSCARGCRRAATASRARPTPR